MLSSKGRLAKLVIFFIRLIFNIHVETFEDFGSSGFTECTSITIHSRTVFQYIIHLDSRTLKMVNHCVTVDAHAYGTCPRFRGKNEKKKLKDDAKINWSMKTLQVLGS